MTPPRLWRAALAATCLTGLLLASGCKEAKDISEEMGWSRQREAPPPPPVVTLDDRWVPSDGIVGDLNQAQWTARWWQWVGRFGADTGVPYADRDGSLCTLHQEGPVWFLAGTDGRFDAVRTCTVPADKHLFVPLINWVMGQGGDTVSCDEKRAAAARLADNVGTGLVLLDGRPIGKLERMRVAAGGCFAMSDEVFSATTDGYWLMLKPLPPGKHQLAISAAWRDGPRQMMQNFRYELDVLAEGAQPADDTAAALDQDAAADLATDAAVQ
ncbi:hypothetical protein QLQ15_15120 [Lysobacter sp. LF1]|uniref:Carboxypeptidase regulatory-like domain-containing protein n=1 Tax=Lysobacter stagni TaxID=3045172 RepID=A0ABT6XJA4_9GAMM|nr:hypothetical protein [Lysobacter sp. LF1]MDI9240240.1 hypothetical protein [Lysobacter sp. LF1]